MKSLHLFISAILVFQSFLAIGQEDNATRSNLSRHALIFEMPGNLWNGTLSYEYRFLEGQKWHMMARIGGSYIPEIYLPKPNKYLTHQTEMGAYLGFVLMRNFGKHKVEAGISSSFYERYFLDRGSIMYGPLTGPPPPPVQPEWAMISRVYYQTLHLGYRYQKSTSPWFATSFIGGGIGFLYNGTKRITVNAKPNMREVEVIGVPVLGIGIGYNFRKL